MKTYICFNDESGVINDKEEKFYVRTSLIVETKHLKEIENTINEIKKEFDLESLQEEIKWQDLWQLRKCFKNNKEPKNKKLLQKFDHLKHKNKDYHHFINYVEKTLSLLNNQNFNFRIILTFTEIKRYQNHNHEHIYKWHIQNHLQRIQMQLNNDIAILVYDSMDESQRKMFKKMYNEIIRTGDFIKEYKSIYESLLFDDSNFNNLLQVADYIAGSFRNTLIAISKNDQQNYKKAETFFVEYIWPNLCIQKSNKKWGAGILEIPTDYEIREKYEQDINKLLK